MFRSAVRGAPQRVLRSRTHPANSGSAKRFLNTSPPGQSSRSWKGSAARWSLAAAGVYYYNTSSLFADEPRAAIHKLDDSLHYIHEPNQPTLEAIVEGKRQRAAEEEKKQQAAESAAVKEGEEGGEDEGEGGLEGLEEEADSQGAFNPETGEINWDCPCLGGMAHGPCGEEFKAAFSCFVYSTEEPKGVECIEKFKGMQDCFREHPEMYGSELEDDEDEVEEELRSRSEAAESEDTPKTAGLDPSTPVSKETVSKPVEQKETIQEVHRDSSKTTVEEATKLGDEGAELLPKAVYDARK